MRSDGAGPAVVCLGEALIDRLAAGGDPWSIGRWTTVWEERQECGLGVGSLGTPVAFAGRLGQDAIGEALGFVVERGLQTALLQRDGERPSRIVLVRRARMGNGNFRVLPGIKGPVSRTKPEPAALPQARWLIGTLPLAAPTSAWLAVGRASGQEPGHGDCPRCELASHVLGCHG